jgi:ComF family protein
MPGEKREGRTGREGNREGEGNILNETIWLPGKKVARLIELLLFPSSCRLCHRLLDRPGERIICHDCWQMVYPPSFPFCPRCGRFFEINRKPDLCPDCEEQRWSFSLHRSCFRYEGLIKEIILLYKYGKIKVLGQALARKCLSVLDASELWTGLEVIVPVPLYSSRQRERGFNQSEVIARELSRRKKIRLVSGAIVKVKDTPPQASLEAAARRENVKGVYRVKQKEAIKGKVVLLVDDVFTTGSTIEACSRVLMEAGAKEVRAMTVAQA